MAQPNPTALNNATRFRPFNPRAHSRSPSRSPVRKAQFTAQHLDPLLKNLSPDSTLRALQATKTIPGGAAQDALAQSIADATASERETGVRAAFAAQKLREWKNEISQWPWPSPREQVFGLGLLPPTHDDPTFTGNEREVYLGYLPLRLVDEYEERIDEIRDSLESLEIEDIKDHVLEAHGSKGSFGAPVNRETRSTAARKSYGRMRDFTALITATVIQALPDLANLNLLLDTWDVRLQVLRKLPQMHDNLNSARSGVVAAISSVKDPRISSRITHDDFESTKALLGRKVSEVGGEIDKLLDMLEGYEDSLPQMWIDMIEKIELDYATWAVEADQIVRRNESVDLAKERELSDGVNQMSLTDIPAAAVSPETYLPSNPQHSSDLLPQLDGREIHTKSVESETQTNHMLQPPLAQTQHRGPSLTLDTSPAHRHRREKSAISTAESAYSMVSDLSNAEIVDATSTQVVASPKISLIDQAPHPSLAEHESDDKGTAQSSQTRPPILQRASTASIEMVPKDKVKQITMRRSLSSDLLTQMTKSFDDNASKDFKALVDARGNTRPQSMYHNSLSASNHPKVSVVETSPPPSPSLVVEPLRVRSTSTDMSNNYSSNLARMPSDRAFSEDEALVSPISPLESTAPFSPTKSTSGQPGGSSQIRDAKPLMATNKRSGESLENKIQDILTTLPTRIRLAENSDSSDPIQMSSSSSTRAGTPVPTLTLSPVKTDRMLRRNVNGDNEVRVFHLTRTGQSRDVPPVKLFVRAVGENGERVMVRVGGGWADLGEYLREYSAHHGRHAISDGRLEVANFPNGQKDSGFGQLAGNTILPKAGSASQSYNKPKSPSALQTNFNLSPASSTGSAKAREVSQLLSRNRNLDDPRADSLRSASAVPADSESFSTQHPTVTTTTTDDGVDTVVTEHNLQNGIAKPVSSTANITRPETTRSITTDASGVTTTTTVTTSPATAGSKYTPLGAAGPKVTARRAATYGSTPTAENEAWVQGMIGKARAVSGGTGNNYNVVQGPTHTTTTMVTSTPSSRRASAMPIVSTHVTTGESSPAPSSPGTPSSVTDISPSSSTKSKLKKANSNASTTASRPKSMMSFGDVSGIRRVFLKKKTEVKDKK